MNEAPIEAYLRDQVRGIGGRAYKFVSPGNKGVPDRLVCLPGGIILFVELKGNGKKSTPKQTMKQEELAGLGNEVFVIDSKAKVDAFIQHCKELMDTITQLEDYIQHCKKFMDTKTQLEDLIQEYKGTIGK